MTASTGEDRERGLPHLQAANEVYDEQVKRRGDIPGDTLSNRLLLARTHAGYLTVKEAAERCDLNYGSWSNWERGARPRDLLDVVRKVADGLGINYEWLLFGGPLTDARGKPTKRGKDVTAMYQHMAVRRPANRPNVRTDSSRPMTYPSHARRPNRVNASQLPEADERRVVER